MCLSKINSSGYIGVICSTFICADGVIISIARNMEHLLDNPVWSALNTGNKNLAEGAGNVRFYPYGVAPFAGLKTNSAENLQGLYNVLPHEDGIAGVVATEELNMPQPWKLLNCIPVLQMVCEKFIHSGQTAVPMVNLLEEHVPQMLALTKLTNPGPFRERTIDFGHYQGIFDGERLVAMAGQRMYAPPYAEISAVCTHPNYAGRGYAAQLIQSQVKRINNNGEIPFLHVISSNERAINLYKQLGFSVRKELLFHIVKR